MKGLKRRSVRRAAAVKPIFSPKERTRQKCREVRKGTGYRSGFEEKIGSQLEAKGLAGCYETACFSFVREHKYIPDFSLPNNIHLEVKGAFDAEDRAKTLAVKGAHPELDIRFVFSGANKKIYKGSKTTYGGWCEKHGFPYAEKEVPAEWLKEK